MPSGPDPKTGILYFVRTEQLAGQEPPPTAGGQPKAGTKDLQFFGPSSRDIDGNPTNFIIQKVSDIAAELGDYHLDAGKTMGIRRIIIESFSEQITSQGVTDLGGVGPQFPSDTTGLLLRTIFPPNLHFVYASVPDANNGGGDAWQPIDDQWNALLDGAGSAQTQNIDRQKITLTHKEFLLVNLTFKSPVAATKNPDQIKWTFGDQSSREANSSYVDKDIGKVALQTDDQSWWVLVSFTTVPSSTLKKPTWASQDQRSQIVESICNDQVVLFFLPNGITDNFYAYINPIGKRFQTPGNPARDPKDQRALYDTFGDGSLVGSCILKGKRWNFDGVPEPSFGSGIIDGNNADRIFTFSWEGLLILNPPDLDHPNGRLTAGAGGLGIYDSQAALDAAAVNFKKSDIGGIAFILATGTFPHAYSPDVTTVHTKVVLTHVNPPIFDTFVSIEDDERGNDNLHQQDTDYELYYFPDNAHAIYNIAPAGNFEVDQSYGSPYNPKIQGKFRTRDEESQQTGCFTMRFLNTDSD